jgi:hypothetical protein
MVRHWHHQLECSGTQLAGEVPVIIQLVYQEIIGGTVKELVSTTVQVVIRQV